MSVQKKEDATYELIVETAKNIFFKEGKFNATTQEIADAAGVNRTLINYYFRSCNVLFELVFKEAKLKEQKHRKMIAYSDIPFREKIESFMDLFFENAIKYPYMEMYLVTHINQQNLSEYQDADAINEMMPMIFEEMESEMNKGNISRMEPVQFLLNLISLLSFPVSMRPLLQQGMGLNDADYDRILADRKQIILDTLFKK